MYMAYQSSITRKQFDVIRPLLEGARRNTAPRKHDLFIVFNAILYIIKNGCTWRDLPKDFPDYRSVYHYFRVWREIQGGETESVLDKVLKKIGRVGTYKQWQKLLHDHGHCGRAKCPECVKCASERI
jgi:transposase